MVPWRQDLRQCATGEAGLVATPGPRSLTDDDGQSYAGQHLQPERPVPRRRASGTRHRCWINRRFVQAALNP